MTSKTFTAGTVIDSAWLNDVNTQTYGGVGSSLGTPFTQSGTGAVQTTVQTKLRETVSVKDFGAIGDGITNDTAAFIAAATASTHVYVPPGTYALGVTTFPATLKSLVGAGKETVLVPTAIGVATTWISFNYQSDLTVSDFSINVNSTTYPTLVCMQFGVVVRGAVKNITVTDGGRFPIYVTGCGGMLIDSVFVSSFAQSAVVVEGTSGNVHIDRVVAAHTGTGNSIVITGGSYHKVSNCYCDGAGTSFFTVALIGTFDSSVVNCIVQGTYLEAIQITDGSRNQILNNYVYCKAGHSDFGISIFGDAVDIYGCRVSGNTVVGAGGSGIGVSANHISVHACKLNLISDNLIISPNQKNDADGAGVYLLGGVLCTGNVVQNNTCVDESNKMRYGVYESASGGAPNNNKLIHNACFGGAVFISEGFVSGALSEVYDLTWNVSTPTPTAFSGSIAGSTASVKYKRRGRSAELSAKVTIGGTNTGAGYMIVPMPISIANGVISGSEGSTGKMLQGTSGGVGILRLYDYAHAYPSTAVSVTHQASGTVEI